MAKTKTPEGIYKCFHCGRNITMKEVRKRVRCIYCGSKILYKTRHISTTVKAK